MSEKLLEKAARLVAAKGLALRGVASTPDGIPGHPSIRSVILVGNTGSAFWPQFEGSLEFNDGDDHPLDRWSERIGEEIARELGVTAIYPFGGPPYLPFTRWAVQAENLEVSPIGVTMHPVYGPWHAYRFALAVNQAINFDIEPIGTSSICGSCLDKPCLQACPVGAYTAEGYDVDSCARYLHTTSDASCHRVGCIARRACPQGEAWQYSNAQGAFHMAAFLKARAR